jgi:hypothetical protein
VTLPVKVAATPVKLFTVVSGVPVRLDASDAVPVTSPVRLPENAFLVIYLLVYLLIDELVIWEEDQRT